MIKIQTANHELPSVTTYSICIFSLLPLTLHSPPSTSVAHSPVLDNQNAPTVPLVPRFNMLNAFNISFLHIILQQFSTHYCKVPMCWKPNSTPLLPLVLYKLCKKWWIWKTWKMNSTSIQELPHIAWVFFNSIYIRKFSQVSTWKFVFTTTDLFDYYQFHVAFCTQV